MRGPSILAQPMVTSRLYQFSAHARKNRHYISHSPTDLTSLLGMPYSWQGENKSGEGYVWHLGETAGVQVYSRARRGSCQSINDYE